LKNVNVVGAVAAGAPGVDLLLSRSAVIAVRSAERAEVIETG